MMKRAFLTVLVALMAVCAFSGIGYAYTAITENSNNTTESEYVLLSQSNYTFSSEGSFEYFSITSSADTYYYIMETDNTHLHHLLNRTDPSIRSGSYGTFPSKGEYYGVKIGDTELSVTTQNVEIGEKILVEVGMSTVNNQYFTYFKSDWMYFLKMYYLEEQDEELKEFDIHWLWSKGNGWNNIIGNATKGGSSVIVSMDPTKTYKVELYFGGPVNTNLVTGTTVAACTIEPKGNITGESNSRILIKNGYVSFKYDSNALPEIIFDKNAEDAIGTSIQGTNMNNLEVSPGTTLTLPANTYSRAGYTFAGWTTNPDGSGILYNNKASYQMGDETVILYAKWTR